MNNLNFSVFCGTQNTTFCQNLFNFIDSVKEENLSTQKQKLERFLDKHQGKQNQRDDITFLMAKV